MAEQTQQVDLQQKEQELKLKEAELQKKETELQQKQQVIIQRDQQSEILNKELAKQKAECDINRSEVAKSLLSLKEKEQRTNLFFEERESSLRKLEGELKEKERVVDEKIQILDNKTEAEEERRREQYKKLQEEKQKIERENRENIAKKLVDEWNSLSRIDKLRRSIDSYELVFAITSIANFTTEEWFLGGKLLTQKAIDLFSALIFKARPISVVGQFKVGKSWLVGKLLGILEEDFGGSHHFIPTLGVSVKCEPHTLKQFLQKRDSGEKDYQSTLIKLMIFDSAGSDESTEKLEDKRTTEGIIRKVLLHIGKAFVLVLGDRFTAGDQEALWTFVQEVQTALKQSDLSNNRIIVVHNCKDKYETASLQPVIESVARCYKDNADFRWEPITVDDPATNTPKYTYYNTKHTQHYFLLNDTANPDYNATIIKDIRENLMKKEIQNQYNLLKLILEKINEELPAHMHQCIWRLKVKPPEPEKNLPYHYLRPGVYPKSPLLGIPDAVAVMDHKLISAVDPEGYQKYIVPLFSKFNIKPNFSDSNSDQGNLKAEVEPEDDEFNYGPRSTPSQDNAAMPLTFPVNGPRFSSVSILYATHLTLKGLVFQQHKYLNFLVHVPGLGKKHLSEEFIRIEWLRSFHLGCDCIVVSARVARPAVPDGTTPLECSLQWGSGVFKFFLPSGSHFVLPDAADKLPVSDIDKTKGFQLSLSRGVLQMRVPLE